MLHAAALWLSSGGFDKAGQDDNGKESEFSNPSSTPSFSFTSSTNKTPEVINSDRFYLLLGNLIVFS